MVGVNKVIIIGNLGRDPELRYTQSGQSVCNFSIAVSEKWKGKDGQQQEKTEWFNIVAWGKIGELCSQYLAKGRTCYIEGRLQTREWENKDGQKQRTTEINASTVQFLGGGSQEQREEKPAHSMPEGGGFAPPSPDDDIPFGRADHRMW